MKFDTFL